MRFKAKGILRGLILGGAVALLTACGGGGGHSDGSWSGVDPANRYRISLSADRTSLPQNITFEQPSLGVPSPYTAHLHVNVLREHTHDPIPEGTNISCNIADGINSGALYYLDGDDEHEDDEGNPVAYRSIVLESNAGGNSFHYHAFDKVGTAKIRCSVHDEQSGANEFSEINITVGPEDVSGMASTVRLTHAQGDLMPQGSNGPTQLVVQAQIFDEANQLVPDPAPGVANLLVRIKPMGGASSTALLRSQTATGKSVVARTVNGMAQFSIISGSTTGPVIVEFYTDRDNNVLNGLTDPIFNVAGVYVTSTGATGEALMMLTQQKGYTYEDEDNEDAEPIDVPGFDNPVSYLQPYSFKFLAIGGAGAYTWDITQGSLPNGLNFTSDGMIFGIPDDDAGPYVFTVRVSDEAGHSVSRTFTLMLAYGAYTPLEVTTTDLSFSAPYDSATPPGPAVQVAARVEASGGKAPYTWTATGLPAGWILTDGVLSNAGLTPQAASYSFVITVTVTDSMGHTTSQAVIVEVTP